MSCPSRQIAKRRSAGFIACSKLAMLAGLLAGGLAFIPQKSVKQKPASQTFKSAVLPVTMKFCSSCHQGNEAPAGINLLKFKTEASVKGDLATWERVARAISTGTMPPKGMPAPSKAQRANVTEWIQRTISADCRLADPGQVTIRRLNREEYNNTIRDLVGLDLRPADDFPSDDVGYGFDNIGDVLSISPLLMEKYLAAADSIVRKAIQVPGPNSTIHQAEEYFQANGEFANLVTRSEIVFDHDFQPGQYRIKIRSFEDHAGGEPAKMALAIAGIPIQQFEVVARRNKPAIYEAPFQAKGGKQKVSVAFLNDFYQPTNAPGNRDRNLHVDYIEIMGPVGGVVASPSHRRIIPASPMKGKERETARRILASFANRAYRRPATSEEVERLMQIYDLAIKYNEPFERAIQVGIQAVLVSPNFLFRAEVDPKSNPSASRNLNGYELATRLSYFLWSSTPDDRLLMLAGEGSLANAEILNQEVKRMLASSKARALGDNFAEQWLTLRKLAIIHPDPKRFPQFDDQMKADMAAETKAFFNSVVSNDRSIIDFIDGKFTYVNARLAKHYGIPNVVGNQLRKVSLAGTPRGGVLTHGSVLTVTSNPTRTSPTKRGRWVLEQLLGTPPPPPPPGADVLKDENAITSAKTLRDKMIQHRSDPACASCHAKMDPLGFGLENFDPIGGWRTMDGDAPVDPSGELPGGARFSGPAELRSLILKDKDQFVRAFSEKLLTYALGRGVDFADQCHVDTIAQQVRKSDYKFSSLVFAIVNSDPFKKRRTR